MLLRNLVEYLTPTSCLICGQEGDLICPACRQDAVVRRAPTCYRCNRLSPDGRTCPSCQSSSSIRGIVVASYYEKAVKDLILRLKFMRSAAAADVGASLIANALLERKLNFDLVTAVPIAGRRYRERGYNQSELIAKGVARSLRLPYRSLLVRSSSDHQIGRSRSDRLAAINGAFSAVNAPSKNQRILMIDDVLTTGATLNECARVLKEAGAKTVWGAVVAKH